MRRTGVLLVSIALGLTGLTGCAGGDDKYCGQLKQAMTDKTLNGSEFLDDPKAIEKATTEMQEIGDAAPSELQDEWKLMTDLMKLDPKKADPKEIEELGKNLDAATKTLDKDAKDRCDLELKMSS